ncbi:MAG: SDR family oxidoreductase [Rhodocyclaceae bacterium]
MDLGLNGKVALITGGSDGIGKATAKLLAAEGVSVAIVARRPDVLAAAADEIRNAGGKVLPIAADISDPHEAQRVVKETAARFGRLDIVVNNAGTSAAQPFESVTDEAWQHDLDLKLFAAIRVARCAVPHLRHQGGGRIINVTAIGGKHPGAKSMPSSVSRAAGIALTKALSKELGPDRILVNTVCIGLVKSGQQAAAAARNGLSADDYYTKLGETVPLGRVGEADEVAQVITFLASNAASYVTGTSINLDGGLSSSI